MAVTTNRSYNLPDPNAASAKLDVQNNIVAAFNAIDVDMAAVITTANAAMPKAGGTFTGAVTLAGDATLALHPVSLQQMQNSIVGLKPKGSCRVATTANITLSGTQTIDGVAVAVGNRVLVKNQTTASQNGIYIVASGAWTLATDFNAWANIPGATTVIEDGSTNADSGWVCTAVQGGTLGTTSIAFQEFFGTGLYQASNANLTSWAGYAPTAFAQLGAAQTVTGAWLHSGGIRTYYASVSGTNTLTTAAYGGYIVATGTTTFTTTLPAAASGACITFFNNNTVAVTLAAPSGNFGGPHGSGATTLSIPSGAWVALESDGSTWNAGITFNYTPANKAGDTFSGSVQVNSNATPATPSTYALRANGTAGGGFAMIDGSYGITLYSSGGTLNFGLGSNTAVSSKATLDTSGNFTAGGNLTGYSDPRLKEGFERIVDPIGLLKRINGGTFTWKTGIAHTACKAGKRDYGVLADEVEAVMPEIVTPSPEIEGEVYKQVDYTKLAPVFVEAIKALSARLDEALAEIAKLKGA